jgi:hypothetical protein
MEKKNLLTTVLGIAISVGVLYGLVYVGSKAWAKGQEKK